MRPTFMGLETAKRGLMVTQKGIDIVGNNISNLKTKGYTRQRLDTVSVNVNGGSGRYQYSSIPLAGQGVDALGVGQIRNPYLDSKFREQYADTGYYDQKAAIMEQLEGIISDPEVEGTGIKNALTELSKALATFSENPDQETNANIVMNAFKGVTQILNEYDSNLKTLVSQTQDDLVLSVEDINTKLKQLNELNKSIAHEVFVNSDYDGVNYGPNDLLDQRNNILDELSRYVKVEVKELDQGRIQVKINGHLAVDASGGDYSFDSLKIGADKFSLSWTSDGRHADLGAGAISGFVDCLPGSDSLHAGLPYYQNKLDDFAQTMANVFNNIIHEDNPDNPGPYKTLLKGDFNGEITAGSITISDRGALDSSYFLRKKNPDGDLGNGGYREMKAALEKDFDFGVGSDKYTGSFSAFVTNFTNTLGSDMKTNDARLKSSLAISESADSERMATSGVSLNEEGINMMTYNKAFSALGRLMTTMDEQLDVIINQMGLVGR